MENQTELTAEALTQPKQRTPWVGYIIVYVLGAWYGRFGLNFEFALDTVVLFVLVFIAVKGWSYHKRTRLKGNRPTAD